MRFTSSRNPLSPLRYPGGKALLAPYISGVLEENLLGGCTFYEPYAGGASVSLELLRLGFIEKAVLIERDPLVFSFWWSVFNENDALCSLVESSEISIENWHALQPLRAVEKINSETSIIELGFAGLFFNRANFSGIIGAGPIGGISQSSKYKIDCRFNKEKIIKQIQYLSIFKDQVSVNFGDALGFLKKNSAKILKGFSFVYIDPPYYLQGKKLYRHSYVDKQHVELANFIRNQRFPWLLSYDDHPRIRELYHENQVQPIYLDYKVKSNRTAQELVISNLIIPPPVYEGNVELDTRKENQTEFGFY
jgi:DNA adenine methylase